MAFHIVESFASDALNDFRSLKGKGGHFERGLFIAESEKIARQIFASPLEVPKALMTQEYFDRLKEPIERRTGDTDIYLAPKSEMEQIVGYHLHQGIMLAVKIPESRTVAQAAASWPEPFLVVALDGVTDAENMGAIIRTAAAFGADAIIVDGQSCNPYLRRSVRVSMGTIVDIELVRVPDLTDALRALQAVRDCRIIGAAISESSVQLDALSRESSDILVFGSEGWGLRNAVMEACDVLAWIPMQSNVDSLNVAIASGIFLYYFSKT